MLVLLATLLESSAILPAYKENMGCSFLANPLLHGMDLQLGNVKNCKDSIGLALFKNEFGLHFKRNYLFNIAGPTIINVLKRIKLI